MSDNELLTEILTQNTLMNEQLLNLTDKYNLLLNRIELAFLFGLFITVLWLFKYFRGTKQ